MRRTGVSGPDARRVGAIRNIVGKTRGPRGGPAPRQVILIGAHYDTKWFNEHDLRRRNDGASGAAVLLEMGALASTQPNVCSCSSTGRSDARLRGGGWFARKQVFRGRLEERWTSQLATRCQSSSTWLATGIKSPCRSQRPAIVEQVF